jgi:hypothetical protein
VRRRNLASVLRTGEGGGGEQKPNLTKRTTGPSGLKNSPYRTQQCSQRKTKRSDQMFPTW